MRSLLIYFCLSQIPNFLFTYVAGSITTENKISGALPTNHDSPRDVDQRSISGGRVGPYMRKCGSMEASKPPSFDVDMRGRPSPLASIVENLQVSEANTDQHSASRSHANKFIILRDISSSITATESTRSLCSLAMAILVVLSYGGFPLFGSYILKSVICFRPLYLLLLTNITIVVAQLLEKKRGLQSSEEQATSSPVGEAALFDQLGNALEIGLLLKNVTSALLMDCSIYSIVVVCCLSLLQRLGW